MTEQSTQITITDRPLQGEADAMRLRQLLIDSYTILGREFNWETRRWEGAFWCVTDAQRDDKNWGGNAHIWENDAGQLVGAVVLDGPGDIALQIHPNYRQLEAAMLIWAEEQLAKVSEDGANEAFGQELSVWAFDWDEQRRALLKRRGYTPSNDRFYMHRRRLVKEPVPDIPLAADYTLRSVQPTEDDIKNWVMCSNTTFGQSWNFEYHRNFQQNSPSHNYDLHIIAETPTGAFAAYAGLTVDAVNRTAVFEPVGTHPDHRRKGLARHVMFEGLRRLQALGTADVVYVANRGTAEAGKFYAAIGFEHYATNSAWVKKF